MASFNTNEYEPLVKKFNIVCIFCCEQIYLNTLEREIQRLERYVLPPFKMIAVFRCQP